MKTFSLASPAKKLMALLLSLLLLFSLSACGAGDSREPEKITFLLDWVPNTNHTGVFAAKALGYFEEEGLDVEIVQGPEDGAVPLVASGKAQFGVDFEDYLAPAFSSDTPIPVTAVAAILQHNTSGIISRRGEGIDHPAGLQGKTYATWNLPVELATLRWVVEAEGGDFSRVNLSPTSVTDVVSALSTNIDAVWIFYGWDGIATEVQGLDTDFFYFKDIDPVFDFYTPVIIANNEYLTQHPESARAFLAAVKKGYEYAIENPEEAAELLLAADSSGAMDEEQIKRSQHFLSKEYQADAPEWGVIDPTRWDAFYAWLWENGLIEKEIPAGFGFSNDYLPR